MLNKRVVKLNVCNITYSDRYGDLDVYCRAHRCLVSECATYPNIDRLCLTLYNLHSGDVIHYPRRVIFSRI